MDTETLEIFEKLEKKGQLTPDAVVAEAASPDSPLHDKFEWDDSVAAHNHRLYQARKLIGSIQIERVVNTRTYFIPKYVHDPRKVEQGYMSTISLKSEKQLAADVLLREYAVVQAAMSRAESMAAVLGMQADVKFIRAKAVTAKNKVAAALLTETADIN